MYRAGLARQLFHGLLFQSIPKGNQYLSYLDVLGHDFHQDIDFYGGQNGQMPGGTEIPSSFFRLFFEVPDAATGITDGTARKIVLSLDPFGIQVFHESGGRIDGVGLVDQTIGVHGVVPVRHPKVVKTDTVQFRKGNFGIVPMFFQGLLQISVCFTGKRIELKIVDDHGKFFVDELGHDLFDNGKGFTASRSTDDQQGPEKIDKIDPSRSFLAIVGISIRDIGGIGRFDSITSLLKGFLCIVEGVFFCRVHKVQKLEQPHPVGHQSQVGQ